ncbi:MAG: phosphatidate cytidylyltransferase [Clostridia bacterium]|nr:phosphatidate cytidylyltransferase [Clostridia bacterium]
MKNRVIFGLIILAVMAALMFLVQYVAREFYDAFIILLMIGAGYEMSHAIGNKYSKPMFPLIVIFILVGYAVFKFVHEFNAYNNEGAGFGGITAFFVVLIAMFVVCFVVNMGSEKSSFENVISTFICMIYPVGIMVYLLGLNYFPGNNIGLAFLGWGYDPYATGAFLPNYRPIAIIMTLGCASCTDIMALFVGKIFKGPKLAPNISPKKTISGAIGGLFGGVVGAAIIFGLSFTGFMGLSGLNENVWISLALYLSLGFCIAIVTEIGDLMASYTKRFCEIKDYGTFIPGHGGIMDRIDGILLASMVCYLFLTIVVYFS